MTLYSVVLYVHVLSAFFLASALSFETLILRRMGRAASKSQARLWADLIPGFPFIVVGCLLVLLLSGGYLTGTMSGWSLGWPKAAVVAVLLFAFLGAATGRRMRAIRRIAADERDRESLPFARLNDPFLKFSLYIRMAVLAGTVLLMTAKPDFTESIEILVAAVILGSVSAFVGSRRAGISRSPNTQVSA